MDNEQRCDQCEWFLEVRKASRSVPAGGKCVWTPPVNRTYNLPMWLANADRYVSANEGRECETWHAKESFINDVLEHDKETRRAALLEARKAVVREYLQDPVEDDPGDIAYDHAIRDAVEAIDRLAQEGA